MSHLAHLVSSAFNVREVPPLAHALNATKHVPEPLLLPMYISLRNPWDSPNKRFPGSKRNPGNARGTDGFPVLCHQFFPSSLSRWENCITSSKAFSLKMNKLRE